MLRIVPLILAVAMFMEMMDSTVIATSLPVIAADIGTEPVALKLALTAYLLALAVFIPLSGWLADRFGARNVFRVAIGVFMLGSLACAVSNSLGTFVGARFLQGMGGSMMLPVGRVLLIRSTPKKDLISAMAWLTVPALMGLLIGPLLGGFITTYFSWEWIFLINIPIGIAGIILSGIFLPRSGVRIKTRLDVRGFLLAGLAFSGVVFGLSVVSLPTLSPIIGLGTLAVGVFAAIAYWRHAKRVEKPILAPRIFDDKNFFISNLWGSLFRIANGAFPFLMPLMLQIGYGLNPFQSGMITFLGAGGAIAMKFFAKKTYAKFGFSRALPVAIIINAILTACYGFIDPTQFSFGLGAMIFFGGFAVSMFFTGANSLMFSSLPDEDAAQASAIAAVGNHISVAIGVAIAGGLLEISRHFHGGELRLFDFQIAFVIIALISAIGATPFARLPADAGANVSGYREGKNRATP